MGLSAENLDDDQISADALGNDVRALRKSKGLTLNELALKVNRSVGFLSQVERGISSPSIDDLRALASAFEVPTSWFFMSDEEDPRERGVIVRAQSRRALGTKETGIVEELLSPDLGGSFEMFRSEFQPGASMDDAILRETEESGTIISGQLDLWIDDELFALKEGDTFRFFNKPYRWHNPGTEPTVIVWVVSPPVY